MSNVEKNNYIVAIDLGSGNAVAAAASKDPDGRLNIIDAVVKPMTGMSAGEVTNIEQVRESAGEAVLELQNDLDIKISEAYAGISGADIKCADSSYFVYVKGDDGEISEEDVVKLHESMNNLQAPDGVTILDRAPQKYMIDGREETMQPVGRFGQQLEATFNFTLGSKSTIDRLTKTFQRLGIRPAKIFTNSQASAEACLTDDEREVGAAVIDIGSGCTDICIWQDNIMRYVGVVPIGSDAVNRDIRSMAIPERFIEKLKITHGYAVANQIPEDKKGQTIKIKGRTPRENKEISFYNLAQIIEARMMDIVDAVMDEIKESGYADKLGSGIVLTGGGAMLNDIDKLFRERSKYDVRVGGAAPELLNETSRKVAEDLRLTSAIGLLLLGFKESGIVATSNAPRKRSADDTAAEAPDDAPDGSDGDADWWDDGSADAPSGKSKKEKPAREPKPAKEPKQKPAKEPKPRPEYEAREPKRGIFGRIKDGIRDAFEVVEDDDIR